MQPIEGITPDMLWTTLIVLVGVGALIVLGDKVLDVWRKHQDRKRISQQGPEARLAEEISQKVMNKLEPRFAEIDKKFTNDNERIISHARQLSELDRRVGGLETGQKAQCRGILALLNHELHNGNADEMEQARKGMDNYLIEK